MANTTSDEFDFRSERVLEGSIFAVACLPSVWPPTAPIPLIRQALEAGHLEVVVDQRGKFRVSVITMGSKRLSTFRPVRIEARQAIISVSWSAAFVRLWVNGMELALDYEAIPVTEGHRSFALARPCHIFPDLCTGAGSTAEEKLLVLTVIDVENKICAGDNYSLLRAAGLLRQLLLDESPLVHIVNHQHRVKLRFERGDYRSELSARACARWLNPDAEAFPGAKKNVLKLEGFLASPCLCIEDGYASVRDVIQACANVKGGVHIGRARSKEDRIVLQRDQLFALLGREPSLLAVSGICRVTLRSLRPLIDKMDLPPQN